MSVRDSGSEKAQALDAGANDYLTKQFEISELISAESVRIYTGGLTNQLLLPAREG